MLPDLTSFLAPRLARMRDANTELSNGVVFQDGGSTFIVAQAVPATGVLRRSTWLLFEGGPVVRLDKVQFLALKPSEGVAAAPDSDGLFKEYVEPFLRRQWANDPGARFVVLAVHDVCEISGIHFVVAATEPANVQGVADVRTQIYVDWQPSPAS